MSVRSHKSQTSEVVLQNFGALFGDSGFWAAAFGDGHDPLNLKQKKWLRVWVHGGQGEARGCGRSDRVPGLLGGTLYMASADVKQRATRDAHFVSPEVQIP